MELKKRQKNSRWLWVNSTIVSVAQNIKTLIISPNELTLMMTENEFHFVSSNTFKDQPIGSCCDVAHVDRMNIPVLFSTRIVP
mmetsp:Transcript_9831/g.17721  ORF Transcript_9831/g.17721 Transcript_9831/m.17721 type:complete len:83 (+) Transcript_9831:452-700(+)